MSESKAFISGCAGTELTDEERAFFRAERPWGLILFGRNIGTASQIRSIADEFRGLVGRDDAPVLIDQEGGRVQRIREPLAPSYPPARALGSIHAVDATGGLRAAWLMSRLHAFDLRRLGITVDCLPVLDVPLPGSTKAIGDRAYGEDPAIVAKMGRAAAEGLMAGGVLPVVKHMPGHGRAFADSHYELPVADASLEELIGRDFAPFRALRDLPMAMTAHIVFPAIDPERPATTSRKVIEEVIRGHIGFDGLVMSDDVSMKALSGDFGDLTVAILDAGCDVVLHCNGVMDEMRAVAAKACALAGEPLRRAEAALARIAAGPDVDGDEAACREEFAALTMVGA